MNLLNKEEYFEFIKYHNNYTAQQKTYFMWYFENMNTNYTTRQSNKQIHNLVKFVYSGGDIDKITKVEILFSRFVVHNFRYVLSQIRSNVLKTDDEVIDFIFKANKPTSKTGGGKNIDKNETHYCATGGNKYNNKNKTKPPNRNDWKYMIETIIFKLTKLKSDQLIQLIQPNELKYLDIGCGNGKKTKIFASYLGINQSNLHGCDITTWGPYKSNKDFEFNFTLIENGKLSYEDSTFDIITSILTLHHVEKLDEFLDEIYRILKPNGIFILIEHNIYDDIEAMIVDVQHLFYGAFMDNNLEFVKNKMFMKCHNQMEWEFILNKHKIKNLYNEILFPQLENRLRYDSLYYGIFQKVN